VPDCGAYLFAGTYAIDTAARQWIDAHLKKDGKTLVWFYASGLYDETGWGIEKMESLTGFHLAEAADPAPPDIASTGALPPCPTTLAGQPEWYVVRQPARDKVLGDYVHGGARRPAVVLADHGNWKSVYFGSLALDKEWARELMRVIGAHRILETNTTVPCYAGRGLVGIWPTEAMRGTVRLKSPSDVYDLYTGKLLHKNVSAFPVKLRQWEVGAFKIQAPDSKPWTAH